MTSIEQYARAMRQEVEDATRRNNRRRRWPMFAHGHVYRPVMRVVHRLGWCFPTAADVEPRVVWCHCCEMRGHR